MGRPKKSKFTADEVDSADALIKDIKAGRSLDTKTLVELLSAYQDRCDVNAPCKENHNSNPNCLCALIPLPKSSRRIGLWAEEAALPTRLGDDPAKLARTVRQEVEKLQGV